MRHPVVAIVILAAAWLSGCVGGATQLRYSEMPALDGSPSARGLAVVDCELVQEDYRPSPDDPMDATHCTIVREGDGATFTAQHNYGVFVFPDLDPGKYAMTELVWRVTVWVADERGVEGDEVSRQEQFPIECRFKYTFRPWETPGLSFTVTPGEVAYLGVVTVREPAEFRLTNLEEPPREIMRGDYGSGVSLSAHTSFEKRALEELYRKNVGSGWGEIARMKLRELE